MSDTMELDLVRTIISWFVVVIASFRYLDVDGILADDDDSDSDNEIHVESVRTRIFVREIMTNRVICRDMIRMSERAFYSFFELLAKHGNLRSNRCLDIEEQVAIFLYIVGHRTTNRVVQRIFGRSGEVISRHFHNVLRAVLELEEMLITQPDGTSTPSEIADDPKFYPYFKNCIGAIDGTHVRVKVHASEAPKYRGRKEYTSQNVLAACTFDLRFTYVLAGWEGTASDARILKDALKRPFGLKIPRGKYYLGDVGFPVMTYVVPPYRGERYHLNEYSGNPPRTLRELFNLRHSSLRNVIERIFGVVKKRFPIMGSNEPHYDVHTHTKIILALYEKLEELYGKDRATGDNAVTAAEVRERRKNAQLKPGHLINDIDRLGLVSPNEVEIEGFNEFGNGISEASKISPISYSIAEGTEKNISQEVGSNAKGNKRRRKMDTFLESCKETFNNIDQAISGKKPHDPNDVLKCLDDIDFDKRYKRKAYFHLSRNRVDYEILIALPFAERASALWDILVEQKIISDLEPSPYDIRFN